MAATIKPTRISVEARRTGLSSRSARSGRHARRPMPMATGRITSTPTSMIFRVGGGTAWSLASSSASPKAVQTGSVTRASTLLMAVSVMFSATSPRARCENRFAVTPPGEAASSTRPRPSSGGSPKPTARPKATGGSSTVCTASATTTAFGAVATRLKSASVRCRPRPIITMARAIGRKRLKIGLSAMGLWCGAAGGLRAGARASRHSAPTRCAGVPAPRQRVQRLPPVVRPAARR